MFKKFILFFIFILFQIGITKAQWTSKDTSNAYQWSDRMLRSLSLEQKIGQLFMVAAYSNKDSNHVNDIKTLISKYHIGGLIFFQGGPVRQAILTNTYQQLAFIPLLISMDAEWGLGMRLDSTISFPRQMALGAISDNQLIYQFGLEVARQCKRLGVHINFAPVVDVNNNPKNPVINDRSFGEDKYNVAGKGIQYMLGMQNGGILANAKHFPGHGNTDKDSHKTLPTVNQTKEEIDSIELYPFRELMQRGLSSVMVAHLRVPSLDSTNLQASSLSKTIVTDLLKNKLNYSGLIFTDALNMKGVSSYYAPGVVDLKALLAGNDVLLFPENVPNAIQQIKDAIVRGELTEDDINIRCKKILFAKYLAGLHQYKPIEIANLYEDLNTNEAKLLNRKLTEKSLTLLKNRDQMIYLKSNPGLKVAAVSIGEGIDNEFINTLNNYAKVKCFSMSLNASLNSYDILAAELDSFDLVIVGLHQLSRFESRNFGITKQCIYFLNKMDRLTDLVTVVFGNPYSLKNFDALRGPIVMAYEDNANARTLCAQLIYGGLEAEGSLPVTASDRFRCGDGYFTYLANRVKYTVPEEVGIKETDLQRVDEIVRDAIASGAMPGCQVLAIKDGKVFYQKAFGTTTYYDSIKVTNSQLYDLASLTKILSTTLVVMKLVDEGKLDIQKKLSAYLPELRTTNKKNILVKDLLVHKAGLKSFIPFWVTAVMQRDVNFSADSSSIYSIKVAPDLYLRNDYPAKIWQEINDSELGNIGEYVYSDLSFYYLQALVERLYKSKLDKIADSLFYRPLGLQTLGYNPWKRFSKEQLIPTEEDTKFRKQLVHGYVHDQGAAMMNGVSGHAGLFGNSNDVGVLMQMLLNKGEYQGRRFLNSATVEMFTNVVEENSRRGLGFDKPGLLTDKSSPTSSSTSPKTFGHTGFTGTCVWADPEYNFVYVFLSNRINPNAENKKLIQMDVRTKIQEVFYQAMRKGSSMPAKNN